jgi:hypothetical protein
MRINSSGQVGIGTTTPQAPLQVQKIRTAGTSGTVGEMRFSGESSFTAAAIAGYQTLYSDNIGLTFSTYTPYGTAGMYERMSITGAGDVGIGTASPSQRLDVSFEDTTTNRTSPINVAAITATSQANGGPVFTGFGPSLVFRSESYDGTTYNGPRVRMAINDDSISTTAGSTLAFDVTATKGASPTEAMQINPSGNVGIGTDSPTSIGGYKALTLNAVTGTFTDYRENGTLRLRIGGDLGAAFINGASGTLRFLTADVDRMRITSTGSVLFGTTTAVDGRVTIAADTGNSGSISTTNNGLTNYYPMLNYHGGTLRSYMAQTAFGFTIISTNVFSLVATTDMTFSAGGAERARIDSSGTLLVGTTSTSYAYTNTSMRWLGTGGGILLSQNTTSNTNQMAFFNPNGAVGSINTDGTGTIFATSSDARLKYDIADADDAASLIDAIQVRKFDWKADGSHQRYGFVAQELVTVAPEAVSQPADPDKMMGVDYSKLVPMLVKEIQSLRARVAQLEGN